MRRLTDYPLEEAMIRYAIRWCAKAYEVFGWKVFKLEYPCQMTANELFDKFWDEIMPDVNNYNVVRQDDNIAHLLSFIPNPRKYQVVCLANTVSTKLRH